MPRRELLILSDGSSLFDLAPYIGADRTAAGWTITTCHSLQTALHVANERAIDGLVIASQLVEGGRADIAYWALTALHPELHGQTLIVLRKGLEPQTRGLLLSLSRGHFVDEPKNAMDVWSAVSALLQRIEAKAAVQLEQANTPPMLHAN